METRINQYPNRADKKTTKSAFDIQMDVANRQSDGGRKGISFATLNSNRLEYTNILSNKHQRFVYLENTSRLSREEREKIRIEQEQVKQTIAKLHNE